MPNDFVGFQASIAKPYHSSLFIQRVLLALHNYRIALRLLLLLLWPSYCSSWFAIAEERDLIIYLLLQPRDSREWRHLFNFGATQYGLRDGLLSLLDRSFLILPPPAKPLPHHCRLGLVEHIGGLVLVTHALLRDIWCLHELLAKSINDYLEFRLRPSHLIKFRLGQSF